MKHESYAEIKDLFLQARSLPAGELGPFLDEHCADDPGLRRELEELLAREAEAPPVLGTGAPGRIMVAERLPEVVVDDQHSTLTQDPSPADSLRPGSMLGRYRLAERIGEGGMGVVWKALDPTLRREIAVKLLPTDFTHDPTRRARLEREAQSLAAVNHPNIATIHSLEHADGLHFITLELIEGDTLAEHLAAAPLPLDDTVSIARQIASALEAAHKKGVVHRDLKPSNVKITPDGRVKVFDFGIAKEVREEGASGSSPATLAGERTMLGTPGYMSPEQVLGQPADRRADLWAFGCIVYECLSGQRAIPGNTPRERLTATVEREPDCDSLPGDTPSWLVELIASCLRKDADHRLGDAVAARRALEERIAQRSFSSVIDRALRARDTSTPNNLPLQLTSLVGRQRETGEIQRLLADDRLVTLTGAGGCGKSRLALEVARRSLEAFPDGVWEVELAPLKDGALVPHTVATALGAKEAPRLSLLETLIGFLADKDLLLVLDNCEHLVEECADLVRALLLSCSGLRVLATSRESLQLEGEVAYRVSSLELPNGARALTELREIESVQLFVDRARNANPAFSLLESNARHVAEICTHLDGIPLAIELAAARVKSMSVVEVADRLDDRFRLLTRGNRGAPPRHQTLRALIDWSYEQLTRQERALFRRLSFFAGGWSMDAAEEVCAGGGIEHWEVMDLLLRLCEKSMIELEPNTDDLPERTRYRLFESVREYAADRLSEAGEEDAIRSRHRDFFVALAVKAGRGLASNAQKGWLHQLDIEQGNFRVALDACRQGGTAPSTGLRLALALCEYWDIRGTWSEGLAALAHLLALHPVEEPALRSEALLQAGRMAIRCGEYERAESLCEASVAIRRESGDRHGVAESLRSIGDIAYYKGEYDKARTVFEEDLSIVRELGEKRGMAEGLTNLSGLAIDQGEYDRARTILEECLTIYKTLGNTRGTANTLNYLGIVAERQSDCPRALMLYEQSLAIRRGMSDIGGIADSLANLGSCSVAQGDFDRARTCFEESLAIRRKLGDRRGIGVSLNGLASAVIMQGDLERARTELEEALAIRRELGDRQGISATLHNLGTIAFDLGDHEQAARQHEESLTIKRDLGDRRGIANSLASLGNLARVRGDPDRARELYQKSLEVRREIGDESGIARALINLGNLMLDHGDLKRANELYRESLTMRRELGDRRGIAGSLLSIGSLACSQGDSRRAASLLAAAENLSQRMGYQWPLRLRRKLEHHIAMLRAELSERELSQAWAAGQAMELDQAIEYALGKGRA